MDITARLNSLAYQDGSRPKKTEAEEIAELMTLGINHPARKRYREREQRKKLEAREKSWNNTPLRSRPANLKGLRPATKEPWAVDEDFYQRKTGSFEYEVNSKEKYDDRSVLSATKGYQSEVTASGLGGKLAGQPAWDSSPMRNVPYPLRGLQPGTREPWAVDAAINRDMSLEGFDTFSAKVENDSVAGTMAFWKTGQRQEGNNPNFG